MALRAAAAVARAGIGQVVVVGGDPDLARGWGLGWVADGWPEEGPLGGVLTALEQVAGGDAVVVACDMPFLSPATVTSLLVDVEADAVVAVAGGHRQPLVARYRPSAVAPLRRAFASGERSLTVALDGLSVTEVAVEEGAVADVDTPADLARARAQVAAGADDGHSGGIDETERLPEIDVHELARRRAHGVALLDVRQPDEYSEAHVPGAVLIPLDQLPDRLPEVPAGNPLLVICRSGARSQVAGEFLRSQGIEAVNVAGGTQAWVDAGFDVDAGGAG